MSIRCRLCRKPFERISVSHLRHKHGITMEIYRGKFPKAPLYSQKARAELCQIRKKQWENADDERKRSSQRMRQSWRNPTVRAKREKGLKEAREKPSWKKNVTEGLRKGWATGKRSRRKMRRFMKAKWRDPAHRKAVVSSMKKTLSKPEQKEKRSKISKERWKDEKRNATRSKNMKKRWKDPEYRKKVKARRRWYTTEKRVARWLRKMGYYKNKKGLQFKDHVDIACRKTGFWFNADFASKSHKLIIHVDGWFFHHNYEHPLYEWRSERDRRIDHWCWKMGWSFLRLTDIDIDKKPNMCRNMIRRLVEGRIVPLIS